VPFTAFDRLGFQGGFGGSAEDLLVELASLHRPPWNTWRPRVTSEIVSLAGELLLGRVTLVSCYDWATHDLTILTR